MTYVLDTNIAFEIAFQGPDFNKYKSLLEEADSVLAPTLYESEVTNTLLKYIKGGYIGDERQFLCPVGQKGGFAVGYTEKIYGGVDSGY